MKLQILECGALILSQLTDATNRVKLQYMLTESQSRSATALLTVDGAALTKARCDRGLGQDEVARQIGKDKATVCRWEQGFTRPSQQKVFELVELFGTNDFVRLNGKAVLTTEEIEVVRKLREG